MKQFKVLSEEQWNGLAKEIKMMLHAHRDCLRNIKRPDWDPLKIRFAINDGYYGEAFGVIRALHVLGYGSYSFADNIPETKTNLKWWFHTLENEVLTEEGFYTDHKCDYCFERFGKDDVRVYSLK